MPHDVFISYSSIDKNAAASVCSMLEKNGIPCWIAPRDITPGVAFAEAIIDGIKSSKVFVLVYSANSNNSSQLIREVDRAVNHGLAIIKLRLEDFFIKATRILCKQRPLIGCPYPSAGRAY